ncbi:MAG: NAD(P)-binding domain-containing protein [Myxococcota bacterium]
MIRVGILGSGMVGEVLANGFLKEGYEVMRGSREPSKLESWKSVAGSTAQTGTFEQAAEFGELIVLAVKGHAAEKVLESCGPIRLKGKTIIDATNPISGEPVNGILPYFTGPGESLMERLQKICPKANFVKAFSCVGYQHMVHPDFGGQRPTMFICGNSTLSKNNVREILLKWGWDAEDMGPVEAARAIEPLAMLWCIPGFAKNQWGHALKLLKSA